MLAGPTTLPRRIAATEIELLRETLFDEVVDRGVEGIQAAKLLALELGKRRVNSRIT